MPDNHTQRSTFAVKLLGCLLAVALIFISSSSAHAQWQAGAARISITPEQDIWLSGFAARTKPSEGKLHDIWAKALVLRDQDNQTVVLVTLDLVGIDHQTSLNIRQRILLAHQQAGLPELTLANIALCTSHTHSAPIVGENLKVVYPDIGPAQWELVAQYTEALENKVVQVVAEAFGKLAPAKVFAGEGRASFAVNRRNNPANQVPQLREHGQLKGPVDHSLPVLAVRNAETDKLIAVAAGYACHATTLSLYQISGDWPGFAQIDIEAANPDAIALVWAGCGADQNPLPRNELELAVKYGAEIAKGVQDVLKAPLRLTELEPKLTTYYEEIDLPLVDILTREQLETFKKTGNRFEAYRAKLLLEQLDRGEDLITSYAYPVQLWKLGSQDWVILGGEVVVDYSLRVKQELGPKTWVAGYSNDVMAYIPSRRVRLEGGYEGAGAMVYYNMPGTWSPEIEEKIIGQIKAFKTAEAP